MLSIGSMYEREDKMTRSILLLWPLILVVVLLDGCKRAEISEAEEAAHYKRTHVDIDSRVTDLEKRVAELEAKK